MNKKGWPLISLLLQPGGNNREYQRVIRRDRESVSAHGLLEETDKPEQQREGGSPGDM